MAALTMAFVLAVGSAPMLDQIGELLAQIGRKADLAAATGTVNAKLAELLARLTTTRAGYLDAAISTRAQASDIPGWLKTGATSYQSTYPTNSTGADITGQNPGAGVWTAWTEVVAANVLTGHMIIGVLWDAMDNRNGAVDIEVGEGAAGAEVGKFLVHAGQTSHPLRVAMPVPYKVTANARIAFRIRPTGSGSFTGVTGFKIFACPQQ